MHSKTSVFLEVQLEMLRFTFLKVCELLRFHEILKHFSRTQLKTLITFSDDREHMILLFVKEIMI